jgi:hypothetical protein
MEELTAILGGSMHLTNGEKQGILITVDDTADLRLISGRFGKLMSEWRVQKEAFQAIMSCLWKPLGLVIFKELNDNMWLLEFANEVDKQCVKVPYKKKGATGRMSIVAVTVDTRLLDHV